MWSVVVTVTASLVPKVEEEKGVPNTCHLGRCVYIILFPESFETTNWANSEVQT